MSDLRRNINRFFARNRDKGIPRLMLWICAGNAIVYLFSRVSEFLPSLLMFRTEDILRGQIWRLFSYVFTFASQSSFFGSSLLGAIFSILFYYWIGKVLEDSCGTLRFNLFYLSGILIGDLIAFLIYWLSPINITLSSDYLNLSMLLAVATLSPESRVYIYAIIPIKMKWLAWFYFGILAWEVGSNLYSVAAYLPMLSAAAKAAWILLSLFPLAALLNYFIFFGNGIKNLFPRRRHKTVRRQTYRPSTQETQYRPAQTSQQRSYRHKCTVCGRTDVDCPDLEFRYCSKCAGYFCYCIDHINHHTHVQ